MYAKFLYLRSDRLFRYNSSWGKFSCKGGLPMEQFLVDVLAMTVAGVLVALIIRYFNV